MSYPIARRAFVLGLAFLATARGAKAGLFSQEVPENLDLSLNRRTENGLYTANIAPVAQSIRIGSMHEWTVSLTDSKGQAVKDADIVVNGGMPQHGHGLPTAPSVTEQLEDGRYLIEGMKFNMRGWWEITLAVRASAGADSVTFNIVL